MTSATEIRENLVRLLAHEQSLNSFAEWLSRSTWNIHRENDEVRELVGEIHSVLAEYSNRHLSAQELRQKLSALTAGQRMAIPVSAPPRKRHRA
jgi:hypothetical protein